MATTAISTGLGLVAGLAKSGSDKEASQAQAASAIAQSQQQATMDQESANLIQGQEDAALYNAQVAGEQQTLAVQTANQQAAAYRVQADQILGTMRASAGASGVVLSGSPLDALKASAANAELNVLTIQHTGALEAWGYENTKNLDTFQASMASYQKQTAMANESYALVTGQATAAQDLKAGENKSTGDLLSAFAAPGVAALLPVGSKKTTSSGDTANLSPSMAEMFSSITAGG